MRCTKDVIGFWDSLFLNFSREEVFFIIWACPLSGSGYPWVRFAPVFRIRSRPLPLVGSLLSLTRAMSKLRTDELVKKYWHILVFGMSGHYYPSLGVGDIEKEMNLGKKILTFGKLVILTHKKGNYNKTRSNQYFKKINAWTEFCFHLCWDKFSFQGTTIKNFKNTLENDLARSLPLRAK